MNQTSEWLKRNGVSQEDAAHAGLLPLQQRNRARKGVKILKRHGLERTEAYSLLKKASK